MMVVWVVRMPRIMQLLPVVVAGVTFPFRKDLYPVPVYSPTLREGCRVEPPFLGLWVYRQGTEFGVAFKFNQIVQALQPPFILYHFMLFITIILSLQLP